MTTWLLPAVLAVALVWKGQQLLRDRRDWALRVVVLNIAFVELGYILVRSRLGHLLPLGGPLLVQNLFLLGGTYLLVCFFVFASERDDAQRRCLWELTLPVLAGAGMTVAWLLFSPTQRAASGPPPPGHPPPAAVAAFYLIGLAYFGYTNIVCIVSAFSTAQHADRHPAIGLRLAGIGLAGAFLCLPVYRTASIVVSFASCRLPAVGAVTSPVAEVAFIVFLIGLCWPGLINRTRAAGRFTSLWRRVRRLKPLQRLLGPILSLGGDRLPSGELRSRWRVAQPGWTYRWAACRDGLVIASSFVASSDPARSTMAGQAEQLRSAVVTCLAGQTIGDPRQLFAIPETETFDADLDSLIALSDAVNRLPPRPA